MKKKLCLWLGVVPVAVFGLTLLIPSNRYFLLGILRQERFEDGRPTSYWIDALKDSDPAKRHQAAAALGRMGPEAEDAVAALAVALKDENELVRLNAALALYKIGPASQAALPALAEALQDDIPMIRMDAALALHRIGPQASAAVPALIQALRDPKNRIRLPFFHLSVADIAALTLGRIGPDAKGAIDVLADLLDAKDSDDLLRQEAGAALQKIDPRER